MDFKDESSSQPPPLPAKDSNSDTNDASSGVNQKPEICIEEPDSEELYLNASIKEDPHLRQESNAANQSEPAPAVEPDAASINSTSTTTPALPVIRIEINKVVYTIAKANIAISTVDDTSSVSISLEVGAPAAAAASTGGKQANYLKSIKTSFKSSKQVLLGAASKMFKGANRSSSGSFKETAAEASANTADSDQQVDSSSGVQQQQQQRPGSSSAEASGGMGTTDSKEATSSGGVGSHLFNRTTSSSRENTIESESGSQQQPPQLQQQSSSLEEAPGKLAASIAERTKTLNLKHLFKFSPKPSGEAKKSKKDSTEGAASLSAIKFPDCMPDKVKAFFKVTSDTQLVATVYAADTSSFSEDIVEAKKALEDPARRKVKVGGRSRSVWLDPTAGEKVEVWKLYFDADDKCQMMLGWLPGTELYGYMIPREIDRDKRFDSPAEQAAHDAAMRGLAFLDQDIYDMEEQPPAVSPGAAASAAAATAAAVAAASATAAAAADGGGDAVEDCGEIYM